MDICTTLLWWTDSGRDQTFSHVGNFPNSKMLFFLPIFSPRGICPSVQRFYSGLSTVAPRCDTDPWIATSLFSEFDYCVSPPGVNDLLYDTFMCAKMIYHTELLSEEMTGK